MENTTIRCRAGIVYVGVHQAFFALKPRLSQVLINHSPDGFAWGYGGSGPSQLALAILLELYGKDEALLRYQDFKWDFIATLPKDGDWEIKGTDIQLWIDHQRVLKPIFG